MVTDQYKGKCYLFINIKEAFHTNPEYVKKPESQASLIISKEICNTKWSKSKNTIN